MSAASGSITLYAWVINEREVRYYLDEYPDELMYFKPARRARELDMSFPSIKSEVVK